MSYRFIARMLLTSSLMVVTIYASAQNAREEFIPKTGQGSPVIAISGQSGIAMYRDNAAKLADAGYFVILVDGKDYLFRTGGDLDPVGKQRLQKLLNETVKDPRATLPKVALVGYSLGGGAVVQWALSESDLVSRAALFYPVVSRPGQDVTRSAAEIRYPVLVLTGALDKYMNCCLVETMYQFQAEAKRLGASLELVVYPEADHGFNLQGDKYRAADAADSWSRLVAFLSKR
jgi:dienelactone hydrolase